MNLHHVAIAVPDMDAGHLFWHEVLGLPVGKAYREEAQGVDVAFYKSGESNVELIYPYNAETGVAKFLEKRGPGMHHICFEVDDIEAMLAHLKAKEIRLIDEVPRTNAKGIKVAFVHPKATGGVLVEFYELPAPSSPISSHSEAEDDQALSVVSFASLIQQMADAVAAGDGAAAAACFTKDGTYHDIMYGTFAGREAIVDMIENYIHRDGTAFQWEMRNPVSDGQNGYAQYHFSYESKLPDALGKRAALEGTAFVTLRGGRIASYSEIANYGPALVQLGFAPERIAKILARNTV